MRVEAIYIAPVKSLALQRMESVQVGRNGIIEDRHFFLASDRDRLLTQRECAPLTQVKAEYRLDPEVLRLTFPDGKVVEGTPASGGEPISVRFHGARDVEGNVVAGDWAKALSAFAGVPVRLVKVAHAAVDALPISILSQASVEALGGVAGEAVDHRRFRPNFYISGVPAHGEDKWIGGDVRIGAKAVVRVIMRDERCVMTTHDPDTGATNLDTLKMIASYRTDQPKEVNFGVYAGVTMPGEVAVGDEIVELPREEMAS